MRPDAFTDALGESRGAYRPPTGSQLRAGARVTLVDRVEMPSGDAPAGTPATITALLGDNSVQVFCDRWKFPFTVDVTNLHFHSLGFSSSQRSVLEVLLGLRGGSTHDSLSLVTGLDDAEVGHALRVLSTSRVITSNRSGEHLVTALGHEIAAAQNITA